MNDAKETIYNRERADERIIMIEKGIILKGKAFSHAS